MNAPEFASSPHPVCTTSEAARRLGVSSTTVQVMVERGELKAWRTRGGIGGSVSTRWSRFNGRAAPWWEAIVPRPPRYACW
ncbi:MAG: excisionase family DNA-binding protein [Betaproteobacteria bacterium]